MSSSYELYTRIIRTVRPLVPVSNIKQLNTWVWLAVAILQAKSIALGQLVLHIPVGSPEAEFRITTLRRWLKNPRIEVWEFYRPLLEQVLQGWMAVEAVVILDGILVFGDRLQIFRLSLRHGHRAIPLAWTVLPGEGLTQVEKLEALLTRVATFLQPRVQAVRFLADAGFRDCDWAELCLKLGWHYNIRLTAYTGVWLSSGHYCRIDHLGVRPSQRRYFQDVGVTRAAKLHGHLSVTWSEATAKAPARLVPIISDQRACRHRLTEYGWRMDIEESFRDDQSGGFDMEHTQLQHPERLERLLLALALATLWCHELGEQVLAQGDACRREIDPGLERELSLFQLGLRWLKRCVSTGISRLPNFQAVLQPLRLPPVVKRLNC